MNILSNKQAVNIIAMCGSLYMLNTSVSILTHESMLRPTHSRKFTYFIAGMMFVSSITVMYTITQFD